MGDCSPNYRSLSGCHFHISGLCDTWLLTFLLGICLGTCSQQFVMVTASVCLALTELGTASVRFAPLANTTKNSFEHSSLHLVCTESIL